MTGKVKKYVSIFLGFLGFLFYFIYDINSIKRKHPFLQKSFLFGTVLVTAATFVFLADGRPLSCFWAAEKIVYTAVALLFFVLLIYTLFFALPFRETYVEDGGRRTAYTKGVYGLCRHPGVLWFAGFYFFLAAAAGEADGFLFAGCLTAFNICYVIFQDLWTFPQTFSNYGEYKKMTPFLIPNRESIRVCLKTIITQ